jgi:hypothetical protein
MGMLVIGAGCQSTSNSKPTATKPPAASVTLVADPRPVVVREFAFDVSQLHTDQGLIAGRQGPVKRVMGEVHPQETPAQKAARLSALLSETIAKELADLKIPASREFAGSPLPANGLLVSGQFLQVAEGNRLKRAVVGFGAGSTEVFVEVAIYDLVQSRDRPVLVYGTGTGSKPMPGAVVTMNPYAMAAKYVLSRNATEKEVRNLGKQIAKDLAQIEAGGSPKH